MKLKLLAIILFISIKSFAQNSFLDSTFGVNGLAINDYSKFDNYTCMALQPDGKILAGGSYQRPANNGNILNSYAVVRYKTNGKIDSLFGTNGLAYIKAGRGIYSVEDIVVLSNGKILVAASALNTFQHNFIALYRLNANGTVDSTFGNNGEARLNDSASGNTPNALGIQSDGKIIVAGTTLNYDSSGNYLSYALVTRFNKNGSLDKTFASNGKQLVRFVNRQTVGNGIAIVNDEIYVVAAIDVRANSSDYKGAIGLIKLTKEGTLDNSFGTGGKTFTNADISFFGKDILVKNNYIILGGAVIATYDNFFGVARFSLKGKLDSSFGNNGIATAGKPDHDNLFSAAALQEDGEIVAAGGSIETIDPHRNTTYVVRFQKNGAVDSSFGNNGSITTYIKNNHGAISNDMLIQPDGKIVAAGYSYTTNSNSDFALIRYKKQPALQIQKKLPNVINKKIQKPLQLTE